MLPISLLLLLACVKAAMQSGPAEVKFKIGNELSLLSVKAPTDYQELLQQKKIEKIEIFHTTFTDEVARDFVERFSEWQDLCHIKFICCYYDENSADILAKGLVRNQHINKLEFIHEHGHFAHKFIAELTSVTPYLKKMVITTSKYYSEDHIAVDEIVLSKESFSELESLELILYPGKDSRLISRILPIIGNITNFCLHAGNSDSEKMIKLVPCTENFKVFGTSIFEESLDYFLEILPRMKNLAELTVHAEFHEDRLSDFVHVLQQMSIEKLDLSGKVDQRILDRLNTIGSLKSVSVPFSLAKNKAIHNIQFTFRNEKFPFEVNGTYYEKFDMPVPEFEQDFREIFSYRFSKARIFLNIDCKIDLEVLELFQAGNLENLEDFDIYASDLENLDQCLVLMPNLRRFQFSNSYAKSSPQMLSKIVANLSTKIEEITFYGQNELLFKELSISAKHRFEKLKTLQFKQGEMKVRKYWSSK